MASMSNLQDDVMRAGEYALRHYVSFSYYAEAPSHLKTDSELKHLCVCSGFLMCAQNIWLLVTAGHVFDEIKNECTRGFTLSNFRLWDGWRKDAPHHGHVPFDFESSLKWRINEDGLDYGVLLLPRLIVDNLKANGSVAIGEVQYGKAWPETFDSYAMIGTPGTTTKLEKISDRDTRLTQAAFIIQLEKVDNPPDALIQTNDRIYARIISHPDSPEWQSIGGDIRGMSGGPIIGTSRNSDGLRYWVIGIQSSWVESSRIIAASPFQEFAQYVSKRLGEAANTHNP